MAARNLITYNKSVLPGGLRVVSEKIPTARAIAIGVWIDAGSRDESVSENGISHFIEHMVFKGTRNRSPKQIASWLESLGGNLNAFTSREQTCFHAIILDEHLTEAVDILSDILMNSTFTPGNLTREKSVVVEEIHEVRENPSDYIHELFSENFWRGHPLGRSILGTRDNIMAFSRKDLRSYMARHYRGGRVVIAAAGNVSHRKLLGLVRDRFDFTPGDDGRGEDAVLPDDIAVEFASHAGQQNHVCMGFPGLAFNHPDRYKLLGLYTYLGAGMSSVLFQRIREEKGMAYTIYAFSDFYRDSGLLGIYFATDQKNLPDAATTILKELKKVKKYRLPEDRLDKIKAQIKGHLTLALESTSGRMSRLGRQEIMVGHYTSLEQALRQIDKITPDDIIEMARKLFTPRGLTMTALGPADKKDLAGVDFSVL